jgi:hypothetical protein
MYETVNSTSWFQYILHYMVEKYNISIAKNFISGGCKTLLKRKQSGILRTLGEVAERLKAAVLKTVEGS